MSSQPAYINNAVALLIGINDYRAYDSTGARDLKGSANDAASVARLCAALGMKPENIHVVASEVDGASPDQLRVAPIKGTSQKVIYEQIDWLRTQLENGDRKGILWYSGHGAHKPEDGLLLCPSDTAAGLSNTIPFKALREKLGEKAAKNLIVVLDCCHNGPPTDDFGRPSTTLGGNPIQENIEDDDLEIGAVVLTACAVGEQAQQSSFASHSHGAFTWALLAVLDQWTKAQQGSNVQLNLTYRELIKKATVLLDSLEFKGTPQIYPRSAGGLAVLQLGRGAMATTDQPDGERPTIQMDTGTKGYALYTLSQTINSIPTPFAKVLVVKQAQTILGKAYAADTEYWSIASAPTTNTPIAIECVTADWILEAASPAGFPLTNGAPIVSAASAASWGAASSPPSQAWALGNFYMTWSSQGPTWWSKAITTDQSIVPSNGTSTLSYATPVSGIQQQTTNATQPSIAGRWKWFTKNLVIFNNDGSGYGGPDLTCTWVANGSDFVIQWIKSDKSNGNKDTVTLSDDGRTLNGKNQNNDLVSGTWLGL